jgi:hypothetical protein
MILNVDVKNGKMKISCAKSSDFSCKNTESSHVGALVSKRFYRKVC